MKNRILVLAVLCLTGCNPQTSVTAGGGNYSPGQPLSDTPSSLNTGGQLVNERTDLKISRNGNKIFFEYTPFFPSACYSAGTVELVTSETSGDLIVFAANVEFDADAICAQAMTPIKIAGEHLIAVGAPQKLKLIVADRRTGRKEELVGRIPPG